ncbi:MAG: DUF1559 domain-containing protein [Armatimonadetes bacterium]|nr:DUF1559 domain-containing protein [Armatimonadota bacterium]
MKRRAFTLIELLVVIAIIAILAAILFPVFAKAREKARQSSCQSNEKQMGVAILQYCQDYDEKFPGRNSYDEPHSWRVNIQPYIKSGQVFACPSNTHNANGSSDGVMPISYGCNGWDYNGESPMPWGGARALAAVMAPASLILVCESNQGWSEMNLDYCWDWRNDAKGGIFLGHMGTANWLFADGHVKALKATAVYNAAGPINMWSINGPNQAPWTAQSQTQILNCQTAYN